MAVIDREKDLIKFKLEISIRVKWKLSIFDFANLRRKLCNHTYLYRNT